MPIILLAANNNKKNHQEFGDVIIGKLSSNEIPRLEYIKKKHVQIIYLLPKLIFNNKFCNIFRINNFKTPKQF